MLNALYNFYLIGVFSSIIFMLLYIILEYFIGRVIMLKSKQVILGIIFYTFLSWIGVVVYIYCIYTVFKK